MCRVSQEAGLPRLFLIRLVLKTLKIFVDGFSVWCDLARCNSVFRAKRRPICDQPINSRALVDAHLPTVVVPPRHDILFNIRIPIGGTALGATSA